MRRNDQSGVRWPIWLLGALLALGLVAGCSGPVPMYNTSPALDGGICTEREWILGVGIREEGAPAWPLDHHEGALYTVVDPERPELQRDVGKGHVISSAGVGDSTWIVLLRSKDAEMKHKLRSSPNWTVVDVEACTHGERVRGVLSADAQRLFAWGDIFLCASANAGRTWNRRDEAVLGIAAYGHNVAVGPKGELLIVLRGSNPKDSILARFSAGLEPLDLIPMPKAQWTQGVAAMENGDPLVLVSDPSYQSAAESAGASVRRYDLASRAWETIWRMDGAWPLHLAAREGRVTVGYRLPGLFRRVYLADSTDGGNRWSVHRIPARDADAMCVAPGAAWVLTSNGHFRRIAF